LSNRNTLARRMEQSGWAALADLRRPHGFDASGGSAGLYNTLFGRDSLWVATFLLETLKLVDVDEFRLTWVRDAVADVLRSLAATQGRGYDDNIEEQPGKIIHEYRPILDARLIETAIPFSNGLSYAGFDQTFLYVSTYKQFCALFPNNPIANELSDSISRALLWIEIDSDPNEDGVVEYARRNHANLYNQSWKDSYDAATTTGVNPVSQPIAWIEIQGYAHRAMLDGAELLRDVDRLRAARLRKMAKRLASTVENTLWMEDEGCYAMARDGDGKLIATVSTNAGHLLYSGLPSKSRTRVMARRLSKPDVMTRFGMRTVSATWPFYAPFAYHRGRVWPFDSAVVAMGFLRSGHLELARRVMRAVGKAIDLLGSPVESYVVLDAEMAVRPHVSGTSMLFRPAKRHANSVQAWTAAALIWGAALLSSSRPAMNRTPGSLSRRASSPSGTR
jgi:glycogen debranching enzyme